MHDNQIRETIKESTALLAGKLDISISKITTNHFNSFITKILECGIKIGKAYGDQIPNLNNFTYHLSDKLIRNTMNILANIDKEKRLSKFIEKITCNIAADAGTILGFKCVHSILIHPGLDDVLPLDVYENHGFTSDDYEKFFKDIFDQVLSSRLIIAGVITDQLPAQTRGLHNIIEKSTNRLISSIIIIPCFCHLMNLVLSTAIKQSQSMQNLITEIQFITIQLRNTKVSRWLGRLCPRLINTRWIYVYDSLKFILENKEEIKIGNLHGYEINNVPYTFDIFLRILIPLKVLVILGERREARLYHFVQHIQSAIKYYQDLYIEYKGNETALDLLNVITIEFYSRIKTWECFEAMVAGYLCSPEGKHYMQQISFDSLVEDSFQDINIRQYKESKFHPSFEEIATNISLTNSSEERNEEVRDENDEEQQIANSQFKHAPKKLKQTAITSYSIEHSDIQTPHNEINEETLPEDDETSQEYITIENNSYLQEKQHQQQLTLEERLFQNVFYYNDFTMYNIGRNYIEQYAVKLGYSPELISNYFHQWLNSRDLPFSQYENFGSDVDELWHQAALMQQDWSHFAALAKRLVTLGPSESDVERLLSKQKAMAGHYMTNLGSETLSSRLILKTSK